MHAGVLEFTSDELNKAFLPQWMFEHLNVSVGTCPMSCDCHVIYCIGEEVTFKHVDLPKGTFVQLQPVSSSWLVGSTVILTSTRTVQSILRLSRHAHDILVDTPHDILVDTPMIFSALCFVLTFQGVPYDKRMSIMEFQLRNFQVLASTMYSTCIAHVHVHVYICTCTCTQTGAS